MALHLQFPREHLLVLVSALILFSLASSTDVEGQSAIQMPTTAEGLSIEVDKHTFGPLDIIKVTIHGDYSNYILRAVGPYEESTPIGTFELLPDTRGSTKSSFSTNDTLQYPGGATGTDDEVQWRPPALLDPGAIVFLLEAEAAPGVFVSLRSDLVTSDYDVGKIRVRLRFDMESWNASYTESLADQIIDQVEPIILTEMGVFYKTVRITETSWDNPWVILDIYSVRKLGMRQQTALNMALSDWMMDNGWQLATGNNVLLVEAPIYHIYEDLGELEVEHACYLMDALAMCRYGEICTPLSDVPTCICDSSIKDCSGQFLNYLPFEGEFRNRFRRDTGASGCDTSDPRVYNATRFICSTCHLGDMWQNEFDRLLDRTWNITRQELSCLDTHQMSISYETNSAVCVDSSGKEVVKIMLTFDPSIGTGDFDFFMFKLEELLDIPQWSDYRHEICPDVLFLNGGYASGQAYGWSPTLGQYYPLCLLDQDEESRNRAAEHVCSQRGFEYSSWSSAIDGSVSDGPGFPIDCDADTSCTIMNELNDSCNPLNYVTVDCSSLSAPVSVSLGMRVCLPDTTTSDAEGGDTENGNMDVVDFENELEEIWKDLDTGVDIFIDEETIDGVAYLNLTFDGPISIEKVTEFFSHVSTQDESSQLSCLTAVFLVPSRFTSVNLTGGSSPCDQFRELNACISSTPSTCDDSSGLPVCNGTTTCNSSSSYAGPEAAGYTAEHQVQFIITVEDITYTCTLSDPDSNLHQDVIIQLGPQLFAVFEALDTSLTLSDVLIVKIESGSLILTLQVMYEEYLSPFDQEEVAKAFAAYLDNGITFKLYNLTLGVSPIVYMVYEGATPGSFLAFVIGDPCDTFDERGLCFNGGTCIPNSLNNAECACTDGWSGIYCHIPEPDSINDYDGTIDAGGESNIVANADRVDDTTVMKAVLGVLNGLIVIGMGGVCCILVVLRKRRRRYAETSEEDDMSSVGTTPSMPVRYYDYRPRVLGMQWGVAYPMAIGYPYGTTVTTARRPSGTDTHSSSRGHSSSHGRGSKCQGSYSWTPTR